MINTSVFSRLQLRYSFVNQLLLKCFKGSRILEQKKAFVKDIKPKVIKPAFNYAFWPVFHAKV
jgi:hypothetical protein